VGRSAAVPPIEYEERLRVPVFWWAMAVIMATAVWWILVLVTPMSFAVAMAAGTFAGVGLALWRWGSARIFVAGHCLGAGRAVLSLVHCSGVMALDSDDTRALRGPLADARAYLWLRPYVSTAVRVDLADPRDPAPYWLLSSRRPDELATAVLEAAAAARDVGSLPEVTD